MSDTFFFVCQNENCAMVVAVPRYAQSEMDERKCRICGSRGFWEAD